MVQVVGVRFKKAGKIYYFAPNDLPLEVGMHVVVETSRGLEYGEVVIPPKEVAEDQIVQPLKPIVRIATDEDRKTVEANKAKRDEAFRIGLEKIAKHGLPMKLVDVEYTFDNSKVIFYFTADGRVDFRELVKDLASVFRMRIELRQIGVRDEARMIGGLGPCGRCLCCATFLGDFAPVSIKMAKEQSLSLNPTKISGICGRLMCCLRFESDAYKDAKAELPGIGETVETEMGEGTVIDVNPLTEKVVVEVPSVGNVEVAYDELQGEPQDEARDESSEEPIDEPAPLDAADGTPRMEEEPEEREEDSTQGLGEVPSEGGLESHPSQRESDLSLEGEQLADEWEETPLRAQPESELKESPGTVSELAVKEPSAAEPASEGTHSPAVLSELEAKESSAGEPELVIPELEMKEVHDPAEESDLGVTEHPAAKPKLEGKKRPKVAPKGKGYRPKNRMKEKRKPAKNGGRKPYEKVPRQKRNDSDSA